MLFLDNITLHLQNKKIQLMLQQIVGKQVAKVRAMCHMCIYVYAIILS